MGNLSDRAAVWARRAAGRPVYAVGALLAVAFGMRAALSSVLGDNHAYSVFYPVVLLASYWLGATPAAVLAGICGALGLVFFAGGAAAWQGAAAGLALFWLNCTAIIYVLTGLTAVLRRLNEGHARLEATADAHADLFQEVNARITHHLRLVAGVLALQARGEPEPEVAAGLRKAAERSMLISRAHAELAREHISDAPFPEIAERILAAFLTAAGQPRDRVRVEAEPGFSPGAEEGTSLATAMLECVSGVLNLRPRGGITLRLLQREGCYRLAVVVEDEDVRRRLSELAEGYLLRSVVEQLGARLSLRELGGSTALELACQAGPPVVPSFRDSTLH